MLIQVMSDDYEFDYDEKQVICLMFPYMFPYGNILKFRKKPGITRDKAVEELLTWTEW